MGNLMTSMYTGVSGLKVNQTSINTTAHNIANVDTEGYTRQQILTSDFWYNNIGESALSYMQVGIGTNMASIRQVREVFYDQAYRLEVGRTSFYESQSNAVDEVEAVLQEPYGSAFSTELNDLWSTINEVAKDPSSTVNKQLLISKADTFLQKAQILQKQIAEYQESLNTKIKEQTDRVNEIGKEIYDLNKKIIRYEANNESANDLRDKRNMLLDELSKLVSCEYQEDKTGSVYVSVEGRAFVTESLVYNLAVEKRNEGSNILNVVWEAEGTNVFKIDGNYNSAQNTDVGSLKGLLVAVGEYEANYTDLPAAPDMDDYEKGNDGKLTAAGQAAYDADYSKFQLKLKDYNKITSNSVIMNTQAQFDQLVHSVVTAINDLLCPNTEITEDSLKNLCTVADDTAKSADIDTVEIDGVPVTADDLKKLMIFDEYRSGTGTDGEKSVRQELFCRRNQERYREATITFEYKDANGDPQTYSGKVYIYNEEDPSDKYSLYTTGQLTINTELANDYSKLPISANKWSDRYGSYDQSVLDGLVDIWEGISLRLNPNSLTDYNFKEYYDALVTAVGYEGNTLDGIIKNQDTLVAGFDSGRQSVAGVSSDDELTNLIKFQQAYNASSRYITVIDEMLEHIVTRL